MGELARTNGADVIDRVVGTGDLSKLSAGERVEYYRQVCESIGLNPLTRPFEYIVLNGKLTLYARKDATEQLRKRDKVSLSIVGRELVDDVYVVTARAVTPDDRTDESIGAVPVGALKGEAKANAMMKAETKAKRRVTLSICGLGWLDETEVSSIPDARPVVVNEQGEIVGGGEAIQEPPASEKQMTFLDSLFRRMPDETFDEYLREHGLDYEKLTRNQASQMISDLKAMLEKNDPVPF